MLAYITSSPLFKGKKKKKKKEIDADTLDDLLEEDDSDSDSENRNETTTNTNSYYSPSNAVYLKRECIELKIKVNALEEELASIPTSGKGKETHVEHARKMMEKDAEILKLKQQNEEKEKLLSVYQSISTSKEEAISMGIDASKLLSFEKTKELQKMCAEARNVRDAYEDELRVVKARWEVSRREKREATYALEMKEKKCNAIESAREALEMDRDEARREMSAMKTELNANASRWRMDVSAWETRCLLAEKKAALLLEQRNIANEQKDIDTEEDESGSEEEEEEEKGKEKTTSGKRVKTKKWALANATNLQASMEDVNKACEEKIKKELEAASAQVLKSKRELETIELKLGVVEVERDAANKSKKNLQIELEKALARESRVLTCLDSLEMEVTGFAEACAEIGVLDSRVATASKSPSWTWHPEFYDVAAASPVDEEEEEGGEQQQQQQQRQRGRQNELVQTQGENKANALFRTVIQTVEERFEALERAFQEMMDDKEPKSLADAMRDEVKLAFISARVAEERSKGGGGGDSNNTTSATSEEKNKNAGESKANGADDDGDDDDDDENRRNSYEIEALRSEIRELTETSELLEHELNEQLTESNAKCEELTIQLKSMTLSHANASNERESMSRALEDAKSRLNSEREKVQSLESALKNAQNEGKRQIQKEIERRVDQEMEMTFEIETLKRDLASKMDRVAELDGRLKSVAAKYEAAKRESGTSEEISQQARVEIERLQKESKAKLEALRIENEELLEKVEDANVRVHQLLQEIEAMDSASAEASEHVSQAMQAIKNASSREISSLKSKLAEAEAFIEATEGMEDELISTREEMSSMKEHFSRREIELRGRIAELENIIEAVRLGRGRKVGVTPPHSPKPSPRKQFGKIGDQDDEVDDDASENSFYIRTSSKADREQTLSAIKSVDKSLRQARDEFDRVRNARSRRLGFDEKGED
ncbi:kinesin K39 [Bathycoccus prasinos]|uniref:Kinesin K39 n=1 Tax=Bathycoccus prasinos TaxID=41875 RepID=K8F1R5_9CHLO|nr:kinesin K39 [Bathycoccus prasinos]CCO66253.1 kinesin K39 [Bathycoccus prasinos]|eukprot:XP_007512165.1 kinesin K39 [Bathycoccus prasinos]